MRRKEKHRHKNRPWKRAFKGPFTRAIFVAMFRILMHAIEWLSHKAYIALHRWSNTFVSQSI